MIVMTAPTGDIGSRVTADLISGDEPVRLIARDPSKLSAEVRDKAEVIEGSHSNRAVVEKAFDGAHSLFWLVPSDVTAESADAAYVDFARPGAAVLERSSVKHVVSITAVGRGWPNDAGHASASIRMDDMIAATGVNYAALACVSLMSNIARQTETIATSGTFYAPAPADLKLRHVAPRDVAAMSVRLLKDRSWSGFHEISMLGPEDLSFGEIARIMTDVRGKTITFREMAMEDMRAMMLEQGASAGMARAMTDMLAAKNDGLDHLLERASEDVANSPTTFRQ